MQPNESLNETQPKPKTSIIEGDEYWVNQHNLTSNWTNQFYDYSGQGQRATTITVGGTEVRTSSTSTKGDSGVTTDVELRQIRKQIRYHLP